MFRIIKLAAFAYAAMLSMPVLAADGDWARVGEALHNP